ncbi:3,4-dihydroxy-2-butanone-4-phosphate synthase [Nocardia tengchongensis]|uniref:3,4-dihydroxy-2-butanone-4-phosphate synthase n=2 Tax=Nocardia tengchongensis TaxID=2055889 RepID=UPI00367B6CC4
MTTEFIDSNPRDARILRAIAAIAAGEPVVVVDSEDRENEGDLIVSAEKITTATMAFLVRHTSGFVCVALPPDECERLNIPPMWPFNKDQFGTAYTVTVDAAVGVTTGISAADRAHTARTLADPRSNPSDLVRPGHVVPLKARPGGVLERPGHTEAAIDLTRLAGLRPAGVLAEVVSAIDPAQMARRPELVEFAEEHQLEMISISELVAFRKRNDIQIVRGAIANLPTDHGPFSVRGYRSLPDGLEHVVLQHGEASDPSQQIPVYIQFECIPGNVLRSRFCECKMNLTKAMNEIVALGAGLIIYLRSPDSGNSGPTGLLQQLTLKRRCAIDSERADYLTAVGTAILDDLDIKNPDIISGI